MEGGPLSAEQEQTRKEAGDDRAEPGIAGGFFAGKDAIHVLRRWAKWGAGAVGLALLLLGGGVYELWVLVGLLRDGVELLREAIRHMR